MALAAVKHIGWGGVTARVLAATAMRATITEAGSKQPRTVMYGIHVRQKYNSC